MGTSISRASLTAFEMLNEFYVALGAGFWGLAILLHHSVKEQKYGGTFCLSAITVGCLFYLLSSTERLDADKKKLVVISGCDSGLGFSMALHLHDRGFMVLAGCLDIKSDGARKLRTAGVDTFELNVTNCDSVERAVMFVKKIIEENSENKLWALINNAGMMVFAEFEWQTDKLMFDQINVNLVGCMRMTKGFAPLLRRYRSRLINISSHCALESLPGLSVYGASKAAVNGLTDSLRVEFSKYGVKVISFIPGSFPTQSNILAKQMDYVYEMRSSFTKEQQDFYGEYFQRYNAYLSAIANPSPARKLNYPDLYKELEHALLAAKPRARYKIEPMRYCIYHALFRISPVCLRDFFVEMFVRMPPYRRPASAGGGARAVPIDTVLPRRSNFDPSSEKSLSASWSDTLNPKRYARRFYESRSACDVEEDDGAFKALVFRARDSDEASDALSARATHVDVRSSEAPKGRSADASVTSSQAFL